jgi:hypothetical protein
MKSSKSKIKTSIQNLANRVEQVENIVNTGWKEDDKEKLDQSVKDNEKNTKKI